MEKIQQAIEKARARREAGPPPRPAPAGPPPAAAAVPEPAPEADLGVAWDAVRVAAVPRRLLRRQRLAAADSAGQATDAFRMLRTRLLARLEDLGGNALAVSSARQGDGKTLVAANLAVSVARHQHRSALLVDLDFRRPGVARCFGLEPGPGASLADYLEGRAELADCLVCPGIDRLTLLPQGTPVANSSELLAAPRMAGLAAALRRRHPDRLVVYDCPPLLATDDALIALGYAAGCLLVVREGRTTRSELLRAAELVGEGRLLGTVLNDAAWSLASAYATHAYYYGGGA